MGSAMAANLVSAGVRVHGFDVLATQYAAYQAYANIQAVRGNAELSQVFMKKAEDVKALAMGSWWSEKDGACSVR